MNHPQRFLQCVPKGINGSETQSMEALDHRKKRILVIDSVPMTRFALVTLAKQSTDMQLCGEAACAKQARQLCSELLPDMVFLHLSPISADGPELVRDLIRLHPELKAIIISDLEDSISVQRAFKAGAKGYFSKRDEISTFIAGIALVERGELYASPRVSRALLEQMASKRPSEVDRQIERLSSRELEIFRMLGLGSGPSLVALELGISIKTVETHQLRIKEKLKLQSTTDLRKRAKLWCLGKTGERQKPQKPPQKSVPYSTTNTATTADPAHTGAPVKQAEAETPFGLVR